MADRLARRLHRVPPTIFTTMSALAARTGAINLGQGVPELREAVARHQRRCYGIDLDPADQVVVTAGATEAIAAAVLGLVDPGDEVAVTEHYYESYLENLEIDDGVR